MVEIDARNEKEAKELTEFFLSTPKDASTKKEREDHSFSIQEIELVTNDATEAEEVTDDAH